MPDFWLSRRKKGNNSTLSHLYMWDKASEMYRFLSYVIEDTVRDVKIAGRTALFANLPNETYPLRFRNFGKHQLRYLPRFGAMHQHGTIEVLTPHFVGTVFHIGNTHEDTAGCPLVCRTYTFRNNEYVGLESTKAYVEDVYPAMRDALLSGRNQIKISNDFEQ